MKLKDVETRIDPKTVAEDSKRFFKNLIKFTRTQSNVKKTEKVDI